MLTETISDKDIHMQLCKYIISQSGRCHVKKGLMEVTPDEYRQAMKQKV